jgi:hypothetical protein
MDSVSDLHREVDRAVGSIGFEASTGSWRWTLTLDGATVATCVHPYGRRIECQRAFGQFLVAVTTADPGRHQVRHLGIGALHDYDVNPRDVNPADIGPGEAQLLRVAGD